MLNFQTDYDEATGEQVLTCFLLPQMDYQVEQGEYFFFLEQLYNMSSATYFFPPLFKIILLSTAPSGVR